MLSHPFPEVYSAREVACAAGVSDAVVGALLQRGEIRSVATLLPGTLQPGVDRFIPHDEAVRVVRAFRAGEAVALRDADTVSRLLIPDASTRGTTVPLIVSTSLHVLGAVVLLVLTSLGLTSAAEPTEPIERELEPVRMVFLAQPGPGGGGGGGGLRMPTPAPRAERQGPQQTSSPIPVRRPPPPVEPPPRPVEPPPVPLEAKTLPPVFAPVAPIAADPRDREGEMKEAPPETPPSQGPGTGGGAGTGQGTGLGEGRGSGIGDGEGGGMGGGPYRPGSGVDPPRLLREVRADYTDAARRSAIEGAVVLEIVVRRDGTVGDVRILRRLDAGLDQRAVQAVRQWRFAPARLKGTPVDVVVEVDVEFRLR